MDKKSEIKDFISVLIRYNNLNFQKYCDYFDKGILGTLVLLSKKQEGLCASELSDLLHVSRARLSVLITKLELYNYAERKIVKGDKRKINIVLTKKGKDFIESKTNDLVFEIDKMQKFLGDDDFKEFQRILLKIMDIYEEKLNEEEIRTC